MKNTKKLLGTLLLGSCLGVKPLGLRAQDVPPPPVNFPTPTGTPLPLSMIPIAPETIVNPPVPVQLMLTCTDNGSPCSAGVHRGDTVTFKLTTPSGGTPTGLPAVMQFIINPPAQDHVVTIPYSSSGYPILANETGTWLIRLQTDGYTANDLTVTIQ